MNGYLLLAGIFALFAFVLHAWLGDREYKLLRPSNDANGKKIAIWIQARSGWHWVSMDLLLSGILLIALATSGMITAQKEIAFLLFLYFLMTGLAWFGTVLFSRTNNKQFFALGQWIFCFITSWLIYLGWLQL